MSTPTAPESRSPQPPLRSRRPWRLPRIALGIGVLLVGAVLILQGQRETASTAAPTTAQVEASQPPAEGTPVQVMKPDRRDMTRTLTLPANIAPWHQATLYGKVPGYLESISVDKGDVVRKGQLLAVIEAPEIEDHYRQAEADYAIKKLTHERFLGVWEDNPKVIAKQDVDVAEAAARSAKHLRDSRRTLLGYTRVTAPFDGIITARFADPGALIQAATGSATQAIPLMTIMDLNTVRVYLSIPQEEALLTQAGVPARLIVKELPGHEFEGSVTRTTESLDPTTRTLLAEIDLPNPDRRLRPGMFITVTLSLAQRPNTFALPPLAIFPGKGGQSKGVFVVHEGRARKVAVTTGIDDGRWVEITEGLRGDEDVVIVGKGDITEGQTVVSSPYNLPVGTPARQKL